MATPNLDSVILQSRVVLKDMHNATTGLRITTASEDGRRWKVADLVSTLIVPSVNNLMRELFNGLSGVPYIQRGSALGMAVPEYRAEDSPAIVAQQSAQGYPANMLGIVPYPDEFMFLESLAAMKDTNGDGMLRVRMVGPDEFEAAIEGKSRERKWPCAILRGDGIHFTWGNDVIGSDNRLRIKFVARQKSITQGGTEDLKLNPSLHPLLVQMVRRAAEAYQ